MKLSRNQEGGRRRSLLGKRRFSRTNEWIVAVSSVSKGLAHGVGDVLGADSKNVQQLLGLPAAGDAAHRQPGHNDARLLAHC